ncbi:FAD:protein FMN transferase [Duganella qianjiadongensis]|uniref:FAD:protein FMN transferase n=1 Tax=Duganella qianjiadongensis TaxID=2692176 RepID=A0ABW9VFS7_9BURK|nr:FAD:protein FMN transferase [Duganella qianjiadongensis]MYM38315.1 FAD:protein FMN transferase [Duganella qianjiadongensis]
MRRVLLPHYISDAVPPEHAVLHDLRGLSMGTSWSVRLAAPLAVDLAGLQQGLQQQLDDVVAQMSHWEAGSHLGRYNRAPAGTRQVLPPAFFDVLSFALDVACASGAAYNPCAGALVNLWGFGPSERYDQPGYTAPTPAQLVQACAGIAPQTLAPDAATRSVCQPGAVQLDLSAVAKGYGVDRLAFYLQAQGYQHYLVEVGGELRGAGTKPDGQPWWVVLEQPPERNASGVPESIVLALHGLAVATSGDYRRYFEHDGQRYSHTIDPRTGWPISNALASVTVIHPQCMAADAWSTALTVLGPEAGLHLAERQGLAARLLCRNGDGTYTETLSSAFRSMLDR